MTPAPSTPVPTTRAWVSATVDYSTVTGPFPPKPVQPLPEDPLTFTYLAMDRDDVAQRYVLTPNSLAVLDPIGLHYATYPLLLDDLTAQTPMCLPPPPTVTPSPPGWTPWTGERCQTIDALRAWLTGVTPEASVGDLPLGPPPPIGGPFGPLQYVGVEGPTWIHFDVDGMRCCIYNGALQVEPFSKRVVMTIASLETDEQEFGWRIHGDVDPNALLCVEYPGPSGGAHQERCTTFSRVREWLLRYGRAMPPGVPTQPLPPNPITPIPEPR